jgi:hypothetical protein
MANAYGVKDLFKNAPNALIYAVTALAVATIAAFVILAVTESDATEFRAFMNTLLNIVSTLFAGTAAVAAGAAAKSAGKTEEQTEKVVEQTNGNLDGRIQDAVQAAIQQYGVTSIEGGDEHGRPGATIDAR